MVTISFRSLVDLLQFQIATSTYYVKENFSKLELQGHFTPEQIKFAINVMNATVKEQSPPSDER